MLRDHSEFLISFPSSFTDEESFKISPRFTRADLFN